MDGRYLFNPYRMSVNNKETTNRWLHVRRGAHTRMVSISLISNSKITEQEFEHFKMQCERDGEESMNNKDVKEARQLQLQVCGWWWGVCCWWWGVCWWWWGVWWWWVA